MNESTYEWVYTWMSDTLNKTTCQQVTHTPTCVCVCVCVCVCALQHLWNFLWLCMYIYTYVCIYIYIYIYIYTLNNTTCQQVTHTPTDTNNARDAHTVLSPTLDASYRKWVMLHELNTWMCHKLKRIQITRDMHIRATCHVLSSWRHVMCWVREAWLICVKTRLECV